MDLEHKFDKRILALKDELAELRLECGSQPKMAKLPENPTNMRRHFEVC